MAEDTAARWTRRGVLGALGAFAAYKGLEALGFKKSPDIEEVASEIVITTRDEMRTSTDIPEGEGNMPNIVNWGEVGEIGGEGYTGQESLLLRLVPLVYGQSPNGPGQGRWAELDIKTKKGDQKIVFIPVDAILYKTAPSISKVQKIDNGIIYTDVGQKIPQQDLGKIDMTRTSAR